MDCSVGIECGVETDEDYENPRIMGIEQDDFGLRTDLRERFLLTLYVRWVLSMSNEWPYEGDALLIEEPDLSPWLKKNFEGEELAELYYLLTDKVPEHVYPRFNCRCITLHQ